jgi:hypothetical protein
MLSVGAQLGCPVRRRIEGEIEIARPVDLRLLHITLKSMTFTDEMQPAEQTQQGGRRSTVGQVQEDRQRPFRCHHNQVGELHIVEQAPQVFCRLQRGQSFGILP